MSLGGIAIAIGAMVDATIVMVENAYRNFEIRIVSGTGIGQAKEISSNSTSKFFISDDWEITPDTTSSYQVWRDCGKLFLVGGNYT